MKIAITTPTGHIGKATTECLLSCGEDVQLKVLGRRPEKLRGYVNRGADMGIGSQDDAEYLIRETKDVDALLWITPPGYGSDNLRGFQSRLGRAAAAAIRTNGIPRVVNISSVGADLESGAGLVSGLHDVEELLNDAATNITHLRPGFFYENLLMQIDAIREWGRITLPLSGTMEYPTLATRDIARVVADRLLDAAWSERNIIELRGPADLSFDEMAAILTDAVGRKVVYVQCKPQEMRQHLIEAGISENAADQMLEMYDAIESGRLKSLLPRPAGITTTTTLAEFVHDTLVPQMTVSAIG
jgi:uncharacterized protein YbjT (DUF2867 family)